MDLKFNWTKDQQTVCFWFLCMIFWSFWTGSYNSKTHFLFIQVEGTVAKKTILTKGFIKNIQTKYTSKGPQQWRRPFRVGRSIVKFRWYLNILSELWLYFPRTSCFCTKRSLKSKSKMRPPHQPLTLNSPAVFGVTSPYFLYIICFIAVVPWSNLKIKNNCHMQTR